MIPIPTSIFNKFEGFDMDIYSSSTINSTVHLNNSNTIDGMESGYE